MKEPRIGQNCVFTMDTWPHPRDRQLWKSFEDRKTMSNSSRNGPKAAKNVSVDDGPVNAPRGPSIVKSLRDPETE